VTEIADAIPLFPASTRVLVPEWTVIGPYTAGPVDLDSLTDLIAADPQRAMPEVYRAHGPEGRWDPRATYREGGTRIRPGTVRAEGAHVDLATVLGRDSDKMAYAICGVYAPTARTAYCNIAANDCADILVNGVPMMGNRVCMLTRGSEYARLRLDAGWNTVVVRTANYGANWWFDFALYDPTGELRGAPVPARN